MRPETRAALSDALSAGEDIQRFTSRMYGLDYFKRDGMTQAAVERKFEIIGEALSRANRTDPNLMRSGYYQRSIAFGAVISHSVEAVDIRTVWQTVEHELPFLIGGLRRLVESE